MTQPGILFVIPSQHASLIAMQHQRKGTDNLSRYANHGKQSCTRLLQSRLPVHAKAQARQVLPAETAASLLLQIMHPVDADALVS